MAHGTFDPVVQLEWGRASADLLLESGCNVEWRDYPMAHGVCPQEIADIRGWLLRIYGALP
jgi:phospholipase/carboxylesterase